MNEVAKGQKNKCTAGQKNQKTYECINDLTND